MAAPNTTSKIVFAIILSTFLVSLRQISIFYSQHLNDIISDDLLITENIQTVFEAKTNETIPKVLATDPISTVISGHDEVSGQKNIPSGNYDDNETERKRAIVIISTSEKAANASLVERFVWSARNIGNFTGWIVLITDAKPERYESLSVAAIPQYDNSKVNDSIDGDSNEKNRFLVLRTQEERFAKMTDHKDFKASTMNSKVFKSYILQYAKEDPRLDEIELFYYLDVDIVFGNLTQPLFDELEQKYDVGRLQQGSNKKVSEWDLQPTHTNTSKIYFFKGNGNSHIQGGQFILDRSSSQPCLDLWRELMQKHRKDKWLKDQIPLTEMLELQWARAKANKESDSSTVVSNSHDCDIVLMAQEKSLIQFPELNDIKKRNAKIRQRQQEGKEQKRPEYPTLLHFRNTAKVMAHVEENDLQLYLRDILRFKEDQEDEYGILNKMLMPVIKKSKNKSF